LQGGVRLLTPLYNTMSTARAITHQSSQRTYPPSSTNVLHPGPFIGQSIIRPSRSSILKSTRRERMPLHSTVRAIYNSQTKNRTTKRHSLMYNPPFSKNVNPNIGHRFLTLDNKHFPKDHKLRKILNHNTVKISYSCMNNTEQIIDNHNKRILNSSELTDETASNTIGNKKYNSRQKISCPHKGNRFQSSVIYQAIVKT